ncbi:glycosyltransferase 87 family protein [Jatrophihabitans telluris]|uniref:Glycosyltransferase 87 family protein n=1 Tax=Jatrophihabitans telluris TaxID=2038343 RepID=A0ABY4QYY0_9ACTN|nr:glycosyltransferase 87 family protein [Jatrophihabitans telluris]UQX88528.1 glycosyltransferase 87 family protein [Jatrophihabitans telluris]
MAVPLVTPVIPPSRTDPTIERAAGAIGGPVGRYARTSGGWWTTIKVLLALAAVTLTLAYVQKSPCANGQWVANSQYTRACYSDVIPLWSAEGLADGAVPYRDHAVEYPVVTGGFMWVSAELTRGWHALAESSSLPGKDEGIVFGVVTCLMLAVCGLLAVAATAGAAGRRRQWDVALFAASPLLIFHAFSNWDLIAMAFASAALWAWARGRPIAAGVMIGLGTAAKLYPALLLVPLALLAFRTRSWRPVVWTGASALAVWLAVNVPVALAWTTGWKEFYTFSASRPAEASTFWAMLNHYFPSHFSTPSSGGWVPPGAAVAALLLSALVIISLIALSAPSRPRLAQLCFLVVAAFLLTTKVWSPQYSVWLVPLLALARPRWRLAIIWQVCEIAVWIATLLWLVSGADPNHAMTYEGLTSILLVRDAVLLALVVLVVVEIRHPELDIVRSREEPDPGAGVFADLPADDDRVLGRAPTRLELPASLPSAE